MFLEERSTNFKVIEEAEGDGARKHPVGSYQNSWAHGWIAKALMKPY